MKATQTCGKRRYADEYEAGKRLKRLQAKALRNNYKGPVRYYYHAQCQGFHLTSRPLEEEEGSATIWIIPDAGIRAQGARWLQDRVRRGAAGNTDAPGKDQGPASSCPPGCLHFVGGS